MLLIFHPSQLAACLEDGFDVGTIVLQGSVGLEALSRGCKDCHFIEMDPWVVSNCLEPNTELCKCKTHTRILVMVGAQP